MTEYVIGSCNINTAFEKIPLKNMSAKDYVPSPKVSGSILNMGHSLFEVWNFPKNVNNKTIFFINIRNAFHEQFLIKSLP